MEGGGSGPREAAEAVFEVPALAYLAGSVWKLFGWRYKRIIQIIEKHVIPNDSGFPGCVKLVKIRRKIVGRNRCRHRSPEGSGRVPGGSQEGPGGVPGGSWRELSAKLVPRSFSEPSGGPSWSPLESLLGPSWAILGLHGSLLGPSWGRRDSS